jgi:Dynamin family
METGSLEAALPPGLLDEVAAYYGAPVRDGLRSGLREIDDALDRSHVTLVFGGHFSAGKSTVINTLTGRTLLPASDFPETGVACVIRHGETERIVADTTEGLIELPFGPDALAGRVSLIGQDGGYRQEVGQVNRILITLARSAIPPGDAWIDSPGINDTDAMTARALETARDADTLVWIVNSRQPLATVEEGLLASYVAEHGPTAVAFLVNVFLPEDTPDAWTRFIDSRAGRVRSRIAECMDGAGEFPVVFLSARAAGTEPGRYGGPEARALLASLSDPASPRVRSVRRRRAARQLGRLAGDLEALLRTEESRLAAERERYARSRAAATERTRDFAADLGRILTGCFTPHVAAVSQFGATLAAEIGAGPLRRDDWYSIRLSAQVEAVSRFMAVELFETIGPCAVRHGRRDLPSRAIEEFRALLSPGSVAVAVPDGAAPPGALAPRLEAVLPPAAIPAAERMMGRMRKVAEQGRRTIDEAREAGKDGSTVTDRVRNAAQGASAALRHDRLAAQENAIAEARRAAERLSDSQGRVAELTLTYCPLADPPPPEPDEAPARVMATLVSELRRRADAWKPAR